MADLFSTNKPNAWPLLGAQDTRKYHLSSIKYWTKRATELTKNSNCSPTNTFRKRYFRTFLLKCIIFEISGKNNITTENTLVFPMFLAVICFSHLSQKLCTWAKMSSNLFQIVFVGLQFEFFVSSVALLVQYLMLDKWYFFVSRAHKKHLNPPISPRPDELLSSD